MSKWKERIAPLLYCYAVAMSLIAVGCIHFIVESEFVRGEVVSKVFVPYNGERSQYVNTPVRPNHTIYDQSADKTIPAIEGSAVTFYDGEKGSTNTIHVPNGMDGKEFFKQDYTDPIYYPFVYAGDMAVKDKESRYLLIIKPSIGSNIVVSVSKRQFFITPEGTNVTIKGEYVTKRHY